MDNSPIKIAIYRWAGQWGPFKIKIPCGECTLTKDVINDVMGAELSDIPVEISDHEWLSEWWQPLMHGGWHAPIVLVKDKLVSQGNALNRGLLVQAVITAHSQKTSLTGNHLFGKETCPYCRRAKEHLNAANIPFEYHDVIKDPKALYEMLARVKPLIGEKTPVTVPQIWLDGKYIGGERELKIHLDV